MNTTKTDIAHRMAQAWLAEHTRSSSLVGVTVPACDGEDEQTAEIFAAAVDFVDADDKRIMRSLDTTIVWG